MNDEKKKRILKKSDIQHFIIGCNFDINVRNIIIPLKVGKKFMDNYKNIVVEHNGDVLKCTLNGDTLNIFYPKIDNNDNIIYLDYDLEEQSTFLCGSDKTVDLYKKFKFFD